MRGFESYAEGIPRIDLSDLPGWLIVIEGTDGVGRTTIVNRLRAHLERHAEVERLGRHHGEAVERAHPVRIDAAHHIARERRVDVTVG